MYNYGISSAYPYHIHLMYTHTYIYIYMRPLCATLHLSLVMYDTCTKHPYGELLTSQCTNLYVQNPLLCCRPSPLNQTHALCTYCLHEFEDCVEIGYIYLPKMYH